MLRTEFSDFLMIT